MNYSNKEVNYLIHLLSCALNEKTPESAGEGIEFSSLLALARKHQVYNIVFPLIKDMDCVLAEDRESWRSYNLSEITRMITVNHEREKIFEALTAENIRFMPLKGLILKNYYPKESMRQMSDNDILFDAAKRDELFRIMKKCGYKSVATGENSDDFFKPPHSTFEFHRELFFSGHDFCPRFDGIWERARRDARNPCMYHMDINDVYIYSVCHMYKHFSTAGCGIRFLADNYVFLKKESEFLDRKYIFSRFEEYGIAEYERKSRELAFKIFDEKELDERDTKLLETYINFGIYGSGQIRLTKDIERLAGGDSFETAKKKYILNRLFRAKKR